MTWRRWLPLLGFRAECLTTNSWAMKAVKGIELAAATVVVERAALAGRKERVKKGLGKSGVYSPVHRERFPTLNVAMLLV